MRLDWPVPAGVPLYAPIDEAARIAGVSQAMMRAWANDQRDPLPQIRAGKSKRLVRVGALPEYLARRESI